jgi:Tannase and feruloyl esterase
MRCLGVLARICLSSTALVIAAVMANDPRSAAASAPHCTDLSSNPQLSSNAIKNITSGLATTAAGTPYCKVTLIYGTNSNENITIVVGLPLNGADIGSGPAQGNWNGRTEGLGGGGCVGNLNVDAAVNANYVGSGTDGGGGTAPPSVWIFQCSLWVNSNHTFNLQAIEDFFRIGIKQQILFSKQIAGIYYQMSPVFNYWNGCSTGGRQGYLLAQELPDELDGILANAPAIYWTRFQTAQMWGQIAMFDLAGETPPGAIPSNKLQAVQQAAIGACDLNDGAQDGIIDDPRTCNFSASANICPASGPKPPNCVPLTSAEAAAVDKLWDGPRNQRGNRIWFPLDRGTSFGGLDGTSPFPLGVVQFEWNEIDQSYAYPLVGPGTPTIPTSTKWDTVTLAGVPLSYPQVAQDGSNNIADVTDTFGPLDRFMQRGGKLLTVVGANDQLIFPRGVINYYRTMARRYQTPRNATDFGTVQTFYRLFRAPGVGHCGGSGFGPWPHDNQDFDALVNWVENGIAPTQVTGTDKSPNPTLTRNLCPYPQTAIYNGTGDVHDASSFQCGGNLETPTVVCPDVLAKYKHEVNGPLDYQESGTSPAFCNAQDGN